MKTMIFALATAMPLFALTDTNVVSRAEFDALKREVEALKYLCPGWDENEYRRWDEREKKHAELLARIEARINLHRNMGEGCTNNVENITTSNGAARVRQPSGK